MFIAVCLLLACASSSSGPSSVDAADDDVDAALPVDRPPARDRGAPDVVAGDAAAPADAHLPADVAPPVPDGGAAFAEVQAIFVQVCVTCHDANLVPTPERFGDPMLPLTPAVAYRNLVGKKATETCGGLLVTPGNPAKSYLYHKLTDDPPCDGKRMPHPGMLASRPPLDAAQIAVIRAWIQAGAPP